MECISAITRGSSVGPCGHVVGVSLDAAVNQQGMDLCISRHMNALPEACHVDVQVLERAIVADTKCRGICPLVDFGFSQSS